MDNYIDYFLIGLRFRTRVREAYSTYHIQEERVPQGSVMSSTLFSLAINKTAANVTRNVQGSLCVDDLRRCSSFNHLPAIERRLQLAINRVVHWSANHNFKFSDTKSVAVYFNKKRGLLN